MAPVLLTGLNKIVDQPEEVSVSVMCEGVRDVKHVSSILILYLSLKEAKLQVMAYTGIGSLAQ